MKTTSSLAIGLIALASMAAAQAAETVIPKSALTPSTGYYTDMIGGGIGNVVVTNGGGNGANIGDASGRNDDGFRGPIDLGFSLNFFGQTYTSFYANNNGNISFLSGLSEYVPSGPTGADVPIISAWFGDVDTRGAASGVMHLRTDIANEIIVTWDKVGYYDSHDDKLDSFQMVVRGAGYATPNGEGSIGFFYKDMQWEATGTTATAAVGFGDGNGRGEVIAGSNQPDLYTSVANHSIWFDQNLAPVPPAPPVTPPAPPVTPVTPPIPEPETYALMLAGLAVVAGVVRRRSRA